MQKLTPLARNLRKNQTDAEKALWRQLRARQLQGYKFRRQHPVGRDITDFCCLDAKLIIELDGGQHADQQAQDEQRTTALKIEGFTVLRFWNNEIFENLDGVLEVIAKRLTTLTPTLSQGERE